MASDDFLPGFVDKPRVSSDRTPTAASGGAAFPIDDAIFAAGVPEGQRDRSAVSDPTSAPPPVPVGHHRPPEYSTGYAYGYGLDSYKDGYGSTLSGDEVHLRDYLRVVYRRRWIALTSFLVVVVSTAVFNLTATPVYEATTQILIENNDPNIVTFQQVVEQHQRMHDYYQTQYRILRSRALARRTIDTLNLSEHLQFNAAAKLANGGLGFVRFVKAPLDTVEGWVKSWTASSETIERAAADETAAQSATIDRFLSHLTISPVPNSRLVDLKFRSPDGVLAASVVNTLAKSYIDQNLEYKLLSTKEAKEWLGQQLAEQRKQVEVTERALQEYRERNDAVSLEDRQNIVVQKLADLNAAVTHARTERIQKEATYNQIRAVESNRATLDTLPAIVSNSFIQEQKSQLAALQRQQAQLNDKLGSKHPDMVNMNRTIEAAQGRINAEIAKVIESLRNDYQQAVAQEASLAAALEQQKREALELNRKAIDYGVLSRDAAANRQVFEAVMQRMKETGVSSELRTSNVRIVDEAEVPRTAASPQTRRNLLLSFPVGIMAALVLAFFFEYLDNRIKSPDEITKHLGLPFLGMVPALNKNDGSSRLIDNGVPLNFADSFRAVRTNLIFSSAENGSRSVVVTSTAPGEGKTLVATNVATALALAGERVILVDGDMRKPRVHEVFSKPQKPGLSNVLVGTSQAANSVHQTGVPGLWVMPAGERPPNSAELLGSKRCSDFMASLGAHFDWVVIDTPPVMATTDPVVAAHRASAVLFVVGAEMTTRRAAQRAIAQLEHVKAKMAGAVLNRVDLRHNGYYYSDYYRHEHTKYYEPSK